jgi:hypothetical protein
MQADHNQATWARRVAELLEKTVENSATPDEEKSAVQLAYLLTRQHGLDIDQFKLALARIGAPPRYLVTVDGFLVPAATMRPPAWDGKDRRHRAWDGNDRRRGATSGERRAADARECLESPTGRHRMVPIMQGTFRTGIESCIHCGTRKQPDKGATR